MSSQASAFSRRRGSFIWLLPTRRSRPIQGGRLIVEGIPVVDAFQAALDVLRHSARGREQSDYIVNEVLNLGGDD